MGLEGQLQGLELHAPAAQGLPLLLQLPGQLAYFGPEVLFLELGLLDYVSGFLDLTSLHLFDLTLPVACYFSENLHSFQSHKQVDHFVPASETRQLVETETQKYLRFLLERIKIVVVILF